jgi:hypothetical protein
MKQGFVVGQGRLPARASLFLASLALVVPGLLPPAHSAGVADLIVNRARLVSSVELQTHTFSASDCGIIEGCVNATGARKLLRFEAAIANIGKGDLVIGRPEDNPSLFEFSECHGHFHLRGAVTFQLCRLNGGEVLVAEKQAFCLRDNERYLDSAGPSSGYDCENQGITAGWEDVYYKTLDCQWLDVTGVPGGTYLLKVTVNPGQALQESNYGNNSASVQVQIPGQKAKEKHIKKPKHEKKHKKKHAPPGWVRKGWEK